MALYPGLLLRGRYQIESPLGRGGFGAVYRALDTHLSRACAVKENLDPSPAAQQQFQYEAVLLARLRHPNVPEVVDYFIEPTGLQYIVMEFVEGDDLQKIVETRGRQSEAEVTAWLEQILSALEYVHGQTPPIIHRDIKPGNIRLSSNGRAYLVDFGIAKPAVAGSRTATGARGVTPGFGPPEQYGAGTDARSDIYALGATLYYALTGVVPPESPARAVNPSLLMPLESIRPDLSPSLLAAVNRAMQIQPALRFQSALEMADALKSAPAAATGPTIAAAVEQTMAAKPYAPEKPAARAFPIALVGAFAAGLVLTAAILILVFANPFQPPVTSNAGAILPTTSAGEITLVPSQVPVSPSPRVSASNPAASPSPASASPSPRVSVSTPQPVASDTPTVRPTVACQWNATYVADVTIPDGTEMQAGQAFTKTWRITNSGNCAWNSLSLVFTDGEAMGASGSVLVPLTQPGDSVDVSVNFVAPSAEGRHRSYWRMRGPDGAAFGSKLILDIVVPSPAPTLTLTPSPSPTFKPPLLCTIAAGSAFASLYNNPSVKSKLGCPSNAQHTTVSAEEAFQGGSMLWRQDKSSATTSGIFAIYNSGQWAGYPSGLPGLWLDGDPPFSCGPESSPPTPQRGFGRVWCTNADVRSTLKNATEAETGYCQTGGGPCEQFQDFKNGMMFYSNRFGRVFILFSDGSWQ